MTERRRASLPGPSEIRKRGTLVAIEGIDGAGKSTLTKRVAQRLRRDGLSVRITHEPSEFETGQIVRSRLSKPLPDTVVDAEIDADYFFADQVYHNFAFIKPLLQRGVNIVSDRYELGAVVYQSTQGLPVDYLLERRRWLLRLGLVERAARHIVLDLPPDVAMGRLEPRKQSDKFEALAFLNRLAEMYRRLPNLVDDRIALVDANRQEDEVFADVYRIVERTLAAAHMARRTA